MSQALSEPLPGDLASDPSAAIPPLDRKIASTVIACVTGLAIAIHLVLKYAVTTSEPSANIPLLVALAVGGTPLVGGLLLKLVRREFGSDLLAGISIVTAVILGQYLAGAFVVLMLSGGDALLEIRASKVAAESRYAKIIQVMRASEKDRPRLRRLGDQLGAIYTPIAVLIAVAAGLISGSPTRFLAVLVVATPCPLLIAIPVAVIGSISLAARIGIIIKEPIVLEQIATCRTIIFDKTGTLTHGEPTLSEQFTADGFARERVLALAASLERYSKHPLATAVLKAAELSGAASLEVTEVNESAGEGLSGTVAGGRVEITSRAKRLERSPSAGALLPPSGGGMECAVTINGAYAAVFRFRDEVRADGRSFVSHLRPRHQIQKLVLLSGDRESEVSYLARQVGITDALYEQSPERMRRIALQSAVGGMALSVLAMGIAAAGYLPPVAGAITQEVIDVLAVLNALRVALPPKSLSDF